MKNSVFKIALGMTVRIPGKCKCKIIWNYGKVRNGVSTEFQDISRLFIIIYH